MIERRSGITLIEVLLSISIVAIAMLSVARAFSTGLTFDANSGKKRQLISEQARFESTLRHLIQGANLHGKDTYLIAPIPTSKATDQKQSSTNSHAGSDQGSSTTNFIGGLVGAESLVFVSTAPGLSVAQMSATDLTFESSNERFGAIGGNAEVALSMNPVGDAQGKRGLFLRSQSPPDDDPTTGGTEGLLDAGVREIHFEFYDGTKWSANWDSRSSSTSGLPAMVRVTYLTTQDPVARRFLVRILLADSAPTSDQGSGSSSAGTPSTGSGSTSGSLAGQGSGSTPTPTPTPTPINAAPNVPAGPQPGQGAGPS